MNRRLSKRELSSRIKNSKKAHGPALWEELKKELKSSVEALNNAIGQGIKLEYVLQNANEIDINLQGKMSPIHFTYDPDTLKVAIRLVKTSCDFQVGLLNSHRLVWQSTEFAKFDSEQVARYVLTDTSKFL